VRVPGGFTVPSFRGIGVARLVLDSALTLHVGSDTIQIGAPCDLSGHGDVTTIRPGDALSVAPAAGLLHAAVAMVPGGLDGRLDIDFADGRALTVQPNRETEAWLVSVRARDFVSCRLGEVAFTSGASSSRRPSDP
jgi:hypothetical protein